MIVPRLAVRKRERVRAACGLVGWRGLICQMWPHLSLWRVRSLAVLSIYYSCFAALFLLEQDKASVNKREENHYTIVLYLTKLQHRKTTEEESFHVDISLTQEKPPRPAKRFCFIKFDFLFWAFACGTQKVVCALSWCVLLKTLFSLWKPEQQPAGASPPPRLPTWLTTQQYNFTIWNLADPNMNFQRKQESSLKEIPFLSGA